MYLFFVFLFGMTIPFVSGRFGKFLPSDPGTALAYLWHRPRFAKSKNQKRIMLRRRLWQKLWCRAVLWALLLTGLTYLSEVFLPVKYQVWSVLFFYIVLVLAVIDWQFYLLPDVWTVPLLLIGFAFAVSGGALSPSQSVIGAFYGYFVSALAVLVVHPFLKDSFGGGDVKMLTALGAWVGMLPLSIVLMLSVVSFALEATFCHKRSAAYGPHLAWSAIIVFFAVCLKILPIL